MLALDTPLAVTVLGLHLWDFVTLVVYLVAITGVGLWAARKVHTVRDFFMPRRFGKAMMIMHSFGTGTHSDQAVGVASKTYSSGLSGIWYQWLWLPCTPFYWVIAPFMKRFRAITCGDIFTARYDRGVGGLYALVGIAQLTLNIGIMLLGSGKVIEASTNGGIPASVSIPVMTALFVVYGIAGGLSAAIVTDFLQGLLTIVFSFMLLPCVLSAVGWMDGLHAKVDAAKFSLVAPGGIGVFYVVVLSFNALVGIVVQPHTLGICAAGKTETEGRVGFMVGTLVKRVCTIAWCLTGFAAIAYFAGQKIEPDQSFGLMARTFFPRILHGLLGIFLASLLASVMSSCDSFMTACSGLFTANLYKPLVPGKAERHYLFVGRVASLSVVVGGVVFAYLMRDVPSALENFWKLSAMIGVAFWLGLFWRRMTVAGAWAATLTSVATWLLVTRPFFVRFLAGLPAIPGAPWVWEQGGVQTVYLPWQMVFYLTTGIVAGIAASLLSRPVAEDKLDRFHALTRTPIVPGEEPGEPCTIPEGTVTLPRRNLLPFRSLELPVPTLTSIVGFVVGWVLVAILIGAFLLIVRA